MLMALGEPLPKQVFGHPWMLFGEEKMSKSRGNVIYADELVKRFGVDAVRYYALHEMPFAQDGTITYEIFLNRYNSDLANTLGNLVNRTAAMINKYFGGEIKDAGAEDELDADLKNVCLNAKNAVENAMQGWHIADALDEIWKIANRANKYIDETTPWILAKSEDKSRLQTVLYNLAEAIRFIASLLSSFMPDTSAAISAQLNFDDISYESIASFGQIKSGTKIGEAVPLFSRIDIEKTLAEIAAETEAESEPEGPVPEPYKDIIPFEDFEKLDIRVGKVLECEKVPKSSKLLRFLLDAGGEKRQILSGISKFHKPEELIGKNVIFIANLAPRKIMGLESNGMILSAETTDGNLTALTTINDIAGGACIV